MYLPECLVGLTCQVAHQRACIAQQAAEATQQANGARQAGGLGFPAGSERWGIGPPTSGHFHGKNWLLVLKLCDLELG